MKNLNLEGFGVQEMDAKEMREVDGGGLLDVVIGFLVDRAWEHRHDIIGTHKAISAAYKKHPEAFLK
ncbi:hypothetical protein [Pedobacter xixiisoli]|uniref:Uncharacterized protein n=1 Tax=Pedobacter xixiisoli TaxID=1476464 RepID=A0A286ADF5_9SPHI|nr:hypothetical protein [Pedobacter xixiisoli]SOD19877.1 hypothetical protein SAMN06297358_3584 [Pedobacter xixiisoli]